MHYVAHHICAGVEDPQWYEEQVSFLLRRLLTHEDLAGAHVAGMTHMKSGSDAKRLHALARVTDLIHSCYDSALTIDELAEAAHWSRFHMMREFKACTPSARTNTCKRRRTQTAARLLCSTELSVAEIAERTGFHERSTLVRRLRRSRGLGARHYACSRTTDNRNHHRKRRHTECQRPPHPV
jgi:AraC-like DNA-binding protein